MQYLVELLSFLWYVLVSLLGSLVPVTNTLENKKPILIIHGIGAQPLAFIRLKQFLEDKNFSVYFFQINLIRSLGFGVKNVSQLAKEIGICIEANHLNDVVLLGLSAGAVPSLLYLENYNGWEKVQRFIALSPACKGSWLSYFLPNSLARQFNPGGFLTQKITEMKLSYPERIIFLCGKWDEIVIPKSSRLKGVTIHQLSEGGHAYLQTWSQKTFKAIVRLAS